MPIYTYQHGDITYTVNLEHLPDGAYKASITDSANSDPREYIFQAESTHDAAWLLTVGDKRVTVHSAMQGSQRYLHIGGQHYSLVVPDSRVSGRRSHGVAGDLTAQMPAQVVDVLVAEGDNVEKGQTLIILEAMKMEIRIAAPENGTVKRLLVNQGDLVDRGQLLVEVDSS